MSIREADREGVTTSRSQRASTSLTPPRALSVRDPPPPGEGKQNPSRGAPERARHCEERQRRTNPERRLRLDCFAPLAMTSRPRGALLSPPPRSGGEGRRISRKLCFSHPEVRAAQPRASKDDSCNALDRILRGPLRGHLRMTER
jgi:hypothetical protein